MEERKILTKEQKIDLNKHALEQWRSYKKDPNAKFPEKIQVKPFNKKSFENQNTININKLVAYQTAQRANYRTTKGYKDKIIQNAINGGFNWNEFMPIIVAKFDNEYILVDGWGRYSMCKGLGIIEIPATIKICSTEKEVTKLYYDSHTGQKQTAIKSIDDFWTSLKSGFQPSIYIKNLYEHYGLVCDEKLSQCKENDDAGIASSRDIGEFLNQNHFKSIICKWSDGKDWETIFEQQKPVMDSMLYCSVNLRKGNKNHYIPNTYRNLVTLKKALNNAVKRGHIHKDCTFEGLIKNANKMKVKNEGFVKETNSGKGAKKFLEVIKENKLFDKETFGKKEGKSNYIKMFYKMFESFLPQD